VLGLGRGGGSEDGGALGGGACVLGGWTI